MSEQLIITVVRTDDEGEHEFHYGIEEGASEIIAIVQKYHPKFAEQIQTPGFWKKVRGVDKEDLK